MVPHADVAVDPVELVGGDVDPVAPGELQQEVLPLPALRAPAHEALVLGDPVLDVHHEVPRLQLGQEALPGDAPAPDHPPGLGPAEDLRVREQEEAQGGIAPALPQLPVDEDDGARIGRALQLLQGDDGDAPVAVQLGQTTRLLGDEDDSLAGEGAVAGGVDHVLDPATEGGGHVERGKVEVVCGGRPTPGGGRPHPRSSSPAAAPRPGGS